MVPLQLHQLRQFAQILAHALCFLFAQELSTLFVCRLALFLRFFCLPSACCSVSCAVACKQWCMGAVNLTKGEYGCLLVGQDLFALARLIALQAKHVHRAAVCHTDGLPGEQAAKTPCLLYPRLCSVRVHARTATAYAPSHAAAVTLHAATD